LSEGSSEKTTGEAFTGGKGEVMFKEGEKRFKLRHVIYDGD